MGSPLHPASPVGRANTGQPKTMPSSPMVVSQQQAQYNLSKSPQAYNKSPSHSMQISSLIGSTSPQPSPANSRLNLVGSQPVSTTVGMQQANSQNRVVQQQARPANATQQQVSFSHQPAGMLVNNQAVVTTLGQQVTQSVIRSPQQQQQPVQIPLMKQTAPLPSVSTLVPSGGQNFNPLIQQTPPKQNCSVVTQQTNMVQQVGSPRVATTQQVNQVYGNASPGGVVVSLASTPSPQAQGRAQPGYLQQQTTTQQQFQPQTTVTFQQQQQQQQNSQYFAGGQMPVGQLAVSYSSQHQQQTNKPNVIVQGYTTQTAGGQLSFQQQQQQPKQVVLSTGLVQQQQQQQQLSQQQQQMVQQQQQQQLFKYSTSYGMPK